MRSTEGEGRSRSSLPLHSLGVMHLTDAWHQIASVPVPLRNCYTGATPSGHLLHRRGTPDPNEWQPHHDSQKELAIYNLVSPKVPLSVF